MDPSPDFNYEQRILSEYYRNSANTSWVQTLGYDAACLSASLVFVALYLTRDDPAWAVIAYLILVFRMVRSAWGGRRWQPVARGMVMKYEAKISELAAALEKYEKPEKPEAQP